MARLIGLILALAVALFASAVGLDRERSFHSTVLVIVASYYGLSAVMSGSLQTLLLESIAIAAFVLLSILGFKLSPWFLVGGLVAHGLFDLFHSHVIANAGVPAWWPNFCLSYDLTAAACLSGLLWLRRAALKTTGIRGL